MGGFSALANLAVEAVTADAAVWQAIGTSVLAVVFMLSSLPKLRTPDVAALALVEFGMLRTVYPGAGLALGVGEGALALSLLISLVYSPLLPLCLAGAAGLLWVFVVLISVQLRASRRFPCYCFGDADDLLSPATLARAVALALLASLQLLLPRRMSSDWATIALSAVAAAAIVSGYALLTAVPGLLRLTAHRHHSTEADGR